MPSSALNDQSCLRSVPNLLFERPVKEDEPRYIGQLSAGAAAISSARLRLGQSVKDIKKNDKLKNFIINTSQLKNPAKTKSVKVLELRQ